MSKNSPFAGLKIGARAGGAMKLSETLKALVGIDPAKLAAALDGNLDASLSADDAAEVVAEPVAEPVAAEPVAAAEPAAPAVVAEPAAAASDTFADGVASERNRTKTVLSNEHFAGRETLAADMLAADMSADTIVSMLAKLPKAGASTNPLAALAAGGAPDLGTGAEEPSTRSSADSVWDGARKANTK